MDFQTANGSPAAFGNSAAGVIPEGASIQVDAVSLVLVYVGDPVEEFVRRLEAVRNAAARVARKLDWILVCDGCSGQGLSSHPLVQKLAAKVVETGQTLGDWPAFYLGAQQAAEAWLLLLPDKTEPDRNALKTMFSAPAGCAWVIAAPGDGPLWLQVILDLLSGVRTVDLGSPCLVQRDTFVSVASRYSPQESLFGFRVYSKARASKVGIFIPAAVGPAPRLPFERVLGVDFKRVRRRATKTGEWALESIAMLLFGWFIYGKQPILGLALLGIGGFMLATCIGKPE